MVESTRVESNNKRVHFMADSVRHRGYGPFKRGSTPRLTLNTVRNSYRVHSTTACKVTCLSACFSAVSVHCCEVLPYGPPLYSCLPAIGSTQYSIDVCSRVHSIQYSVDVCRRVQYLHVLSTIWSTPHLLVCHEYFGPRLILVRPDQNRQPEMVRADQN